jgi:hypothetical protein
MHRSLLEKIDKDYEANSNYFKHRRNAAGTVRFSAFQKISAAKQVIAYGIPADYASEYLRIGQDTITEYLHIDQDTTTESIRRFSKMVIRLYGDWYLRAPNEKDTKRLMRLMEMNKKGVGGHAW